MTRRRSLGYLRAAATAALLCTAWTLNWAAVSASGGIKYAVQIRDANGTLVEPVFMSGQAKSGIVRAEIWAVGNNGVHTERDRSTYNSLDAVTSVAPTAPDFDMAAMGSFSGGVAGSHFISGYSTVPGSYVNAISAVLYTLLVPAHGVLTLDGISQAWTQSIGFDPASYGFGQQSHANVRLIVSSPYYASGVLGSTIESTGSLATPDVHGSFSKTFSKLFANPSEVPMYVVFDASASFRMTNFVAGPVPEPSALGLWTVALSMIALTVRRRRAEPRVQ